MGARQCGSQNRCCHLVAFKQEPNLYSIWAENTILKQNVLYLAQVAVLQASTSATGVSVLKGSKPKGWVDVSFY